MTNTLSTDLLSGALLSGALAPASSVGPVEGHSPGHDAERKSRRRDNEAGSERGQPETPDAPDPQPGHHLDRLA